MSVERQNSLRRGEYLDPKTGATMPSKRLPDKGCANKGLVFYWTLDRLIMHTIARLYLRYTKSSI